MSEFQKKFADPQLSSTADQKLKKLKQTGSAHAYLTHFVKLSSHLEMTEQTKINHFMKGLKPMIKDNLINRPLTLIGWKNIIIQVNTNLHQHNLEQKDESKGKSSNHKPSTSSKPSTSTLPTSVVSTTPDVIPMDVDVIHTGQGKLTQEEHDYWFKNNLCLYCGKLGHIASSHKKKGIDADQGKAKPESKGFSANNGVDQCSLISTPIPFTQATTSKWIHHITTVPKFPLHPHLLQNPHDHAHFSIAITLSFPKQKPISTYTFVDSEATRSHISDTFIIWHSLIKQAKIAPMPIFTIDDQPSSSGLLTHNMITQIDIHDHKEVTALGICSMPYPVLLSLDWLKQHNPAIDWTHGQLSLSCCSLTSIVPAFGKGYGLLNPTATCFTLSIASVGIGYGLNNLEISSIVGNMKNLCSSKSYPAGT